MLKKIVLSLVGTAGILSIGAVQKLPSCTFAPNPEKGKPDILELKGKQNQLNTVHFDMKESASFGSTKAIRLVNLKDPSKVFYIGLRCPLGASQLFRNVTNEPARIACYKCEGISSCVNNCFRQAKLEAATNDERSNPMINCIEKCQPVNCSEVLQEPDKGKCVYVDSSRATCVYTDQSGQQIMDDACALGLIETPPAAPKRR